jgi:Phosphate-selective porin O and P
MANRLKRSTVFGALVIAAALLTSAPADAQILLKVNDNVFLRFGIQMQDWADMQQDATTKGYAENLFIRRARFLLTGQVAPNVTFFFQTDNPNVGKAPKSATSLTSGFILQDAWAEWKISDAIALDAGEFLVPLSRIALTSTTSFLTLDISPTATVFSGPTQSNGLRDTGFELKGYLVGGRLEYRGAIFQGLRDTGATGTLAGRNAFRHSAFLQYEFFEKERGYVYRGTNLGKNKILAISGGYDGQKTYKSYSGNVYASLPMGAGNEFAGQIQRSHYDGGTYITALPRQNDDVIELGYYLSALKLQPFFKVEDQKFNPAATPSKDQNRVGGGLNYYVSGQNLKFTGQVLRVKPKNNAINSTTEFTIQMQMWYY